MREMVPLGYEFCQGNHFVVDQEADQPGNWLLNKNQRLKKLESYRPAMDIFEGQSRYLVPESFKEVNFSKIPNICNSRN